MNKKFPLHTGMSKVALAITLVCSSAASLANDGLSSSSRLAESQLKMVMTFTQNYALDGTLTVRSQNGPITKSDSGYGLERNVQNQTSLNFGGMPRALSTGTAPAAEMTQAQALQGAKEWSSLYITKSATAMAEELVRIGAGAGIFTYSEEVSITRPDDTPVTKVLSFVMTVDRSGRATYGAPVLTNPDPDIIHATYTPFDAGDDFASENWRLPNGGTLAYQVLDSKGNAKSAMTYLDARGAYDASSGDSSTMIGCLMDKSTTGCSVPGDVADVKELMLKHAADLAIVDYTSQVVPVYDEVTGADGEAEYFPRGAVSYTDRIWNCKEYKNEGHYGYVLEVSAARYYGTLEADHKVSYVYQSQYAGTMLSDVKDFSKSVLASTFTGKPDGYLISHLTGDDSLLTLNSPETSNLTYLAPVRSVGDPSAFANARTSGHSSLRKISEAGPYHSFEWGTGGRFTHRTGGYSAAMSFELESESDFGEFGIYHSAIDDWGVITLNDTPVFSTPQAGLSDVQYAGTTNEYGQCIANRCGGTVFHQHKSGYGNSASWSPSTATMIQRATGLTTVTSWVCGQEVHQSDEGGGSTTRACMANPQRTYARCSIASSGGDGDYPYFRCSQSAACGTSSMGGSYRIELTNLAGSKSCYNGDHGEAVSTRYVDLTPYLKAGTNTMRMSHIVTREGHALVYFRVAGCAALSGFSNGPQAEVPPSGTQSGVSSALNGNMGIPAVTE